MLSIPPATIISACPSKMDCAPRAMDFMPLAHTLLTVVQMTSFGSPAPFAACLAGACPRLACRTHPINTSWTCAALTPALSSAPLMAMAPRRVAERSLRMPPKAPIGVRTADTMTTSLFMLCVWRRKYTKILTIVSVFYRRDHIFLEP